MQLPEPADRATAPQHARRTPRIQGTQSRGLEGECLALTGQGQQCRKIALEVTEVARLARLFRNAPLLGQTRTDRNRRERLDLTLGRAIIQQFETRAVLEQADPVLVPSLVLESRAQQSRPQ